MVLLDLGVQAEQNILDAYKAAELIKETTSEDLTTGLLKDLELVEDWTIDKGKKVRITGRELLEDNLKHNKL